MSDGENGSERAAKRARTDAEVAAPSSPMGDVMAATRAQLARTADPHLQAQLLLQYSAQAVAPAAPTEAAIDFLFAFLQQSQSNGGGDQTKSPPAAENSSSTNAVVVAAIVRGLRALLAVKPHLVEPMIQLDAMGEQLTQCISVPEDFKLRRDMLRIVLDCLLGSRKFHEAQLLLHACLADHDDGLRAVCLDGYERVLAAGIPLEDASSRELVERLRGVLLAGDDERTRAGSARLLGRIAEASFKSASSSAATLQDRILGSLALCVRDTSPCVRMEVARAFRGFRDATSPDALLVHLLHKNQINEDLAEIDNQSATMLTSGALLTLLEDDHLEVAVTTSASMRVLCDSGLWSSELVGRAVLTHLELAARVGHHQEYALEVLGNLAMFLEKWNTIEETPYAVSHEALCYLLGSLTTASVAVTHEALTVIRLLSIDTPQAATRIVQFLISCSKTKPIEPVPPALLKSMHSSTEMIVQKWIEFSIILPVDMMVSLRSVGLAPTANPVASACQRIHDALSQPTERLVRTPVYAPKTRAPTFLVGN